jgi:inner membrane protein
MLDSMEPVTHFLTGACLARAGFNRKAAYATLAMTLAAEMPDIDVLWSLRGSVVSFQHHRGITHTFLGLPFEAALVVGLIWLLHRWRSGRGESTAAPVRWGLLYCFSLLALLSHLLLDWTNNYGIRPLFPFNPHWYAGSFVFIFEPVIFCLLLLAFIAPALAGLIGSEIGVRRQPFRGRGWAIFALLGIVSLWSFRFVQRARAQQIATGEELSSDSGGMEVLRTFANPSPVNPFTWHVVVETPEFYQLITVDTLTGARQTSEQADRFYKPAENTDTLAAKESPGGKVFLDWSMFPVLTNLGADPGNPNLTVFSFRDLRFLYDVWFLHGRENPPLQMRVYVDRNHHAVLEDMGSKPRN